MPDSQHSLASADTRQELANALADAHIRFQAAPNPSPEWDLAHRQVLTAETALRAHDDAAHRVRRIQDLRDEAATGLAPALEQQAAAVAVVSNLEAERARAEVRISQTEAKAQTAREDYEKAKRQQVLDIVQGLEPAPLMQFAGYDEALADMRSSLAVLESEIVAARETVTAAGRDVALGVACRAYAEVYAAVEGLRDQVLLLKTAMRRYDGPNPWTEVLGVAVGHDHFKIHVVDKTLTDVNQTEFDRLYSEALSSK